MEHKIATLIDNLANRLEQKGLLKEAAELDVISNTVEAGLFGLGKYKRDPALEGLEKEIGKRVDENPPLKHANKVPYNKVDENGNIKQQLGDVRFRTKTMPTADLKDAFEKGFDGYWYLKDHEVQVNERPDGTFYLEKKDKNLGDVKGLEEAEWSN